MNHRQPPSPTKLQPITPEAMVHISDLVERDNIDLPQRCARYRRRASIRRTALAVCFFFGCCISYTSIISAPLYDQITTSSDAGNQHICEAIRLSIENVS
ncbi:MAG: hypothetical protein J6X58_02025 [Bacteroidales bacterium]|nr:hypothetical protein [Bacteroidales bacterium]